MKKFARFLTMTLVASIMVTVSSCAKDENTDTTNNGSSGRDNPTENAPRGYTMGYYHPERKIKEIKYYDISSQINGGVIEYADTVVIRRTEFTWEGNNLKTIKENCGWSDEKIHECQYDSLGYISSWSLGNKCMNYHYYTKGNSTYSYYGNAIIGHIFYYMPIDIEWTFDDNGTLLTGYDNEITMQNGNATGIKVGNEYHTYSFDSKKNPFTDLIGPPLSEHSMCNVIYEVSYNDTRDNYDIPDLLSYSKNNLIPTNKTFSYDGWTKTYTYNVNYDTKGWPVKWECIEKSYDGGVITSESTQQITIEYYN